MTINKKIFLLFSALFIILLTLIYFILKDRENSAILFENQLVKNKVSNLLNVLKGTNELLNNVSYEYSKNENIIELLKNHNESNTNFYDIASKLNISYFLLLDKNKEITYSEVYDISSKEYLDISSSTNAFFKSRNLDRLVNNENKLKFTTIDYEGLLFSIEKLDNYGYIFVARAIDSSFLSSLSSMLDSYVSYIPSFTMHRYKKQDSYKYNVLKADDKTIYTTVEIDDTINDESFYFTIKIKREFFNEMINSNKTLMQLFFVSFVLFNLIIYVFISKIFTKRIGLISKTVKNISKKKDLVENIELIYDDEITHLSSKMNEMFKIIHAAQNETIKKERDFLQSVLDSQQHIIFITDGSQIQSANKKFLDVFKTSNLFLNNIAILDNETKANLLKVAKKHSSIDKPAKLKIDEDEHKYYVFDISRVELSKYIICMNDVSKYNERIVELENKASIDELTSCYNKNTISDYCKYWLEIKDFGLIVLDIDKFKSINDTYGHFIGDCILSDLSDLVKSHLHSDDLIGRFGGEEFIIAVNTSIENLESIANRIRVLIELKEFIYDDIKLSITASLGCTYCTSGQDFDELFKVADEALYEAKNTGRNKVVLKK